MTADLNWQEVNFDGLVGPTHNYAGLSVGNKASLSNANATSNPRAAARQGLAKMRLMLSLGVPQGILPPHQRPDPQLLAELGLPASATIDQVPGDLRSIAMSASAMWTANAATVSPSADTGDGRLHITPANLLTIAHRCVEPPQTTAILRTIFSDRHHFMVHEPLPRHSRFSDEGAANHNRVVGDHGQPAIHLFVYGREDGEDLGGPFPRRQTKLAGKLIADSHGLDPSRVVFARQSAKAIDAGAFHNDVVAVVNKTVVFYHEDAFERPLDSLLSEMPPDAPGIHAVQVGRERVPLDAAIRTYLFNSQLVSLPQGKMVLITPDNVNDEDSTRRCLEEIAADPNHPIAEVHTMNLRQSMRNGGGPACLRLRVAMAGPQRDALTGRVLATVSLLDELERWVDHHYRDVLTADDLGDPSLAEESGAALDELTQILQLGSLYPFQQ